MSREVRLRRGGYYLPDGGGNSRLEAGVLLLVVIMWHSKISRSSSLE